MVVTLKDGKVVTLFEAKEARELVGEELYDFIEKELNKENEKDERIYELECENNDLYHETQTMEEFMDSAKSDIEEVLELLDNEDFESNIEEVKERLKYAMEMLS